MSTVEKNILIATRVVGRGDTWKLIEDNSIHPTLTETLEAYFQIIQRACEFRLAPLKGELYIISNEEIKEAPPKKFNIYGDF